ncbi:MAG: hypothetical protein FJ254_03345 [Phycisphaerae bacterium]|nr:hypothetical protein [Phycisphaerae bacterium]
MKLFWALLAILLAAGAWILLAPEGADSPPAMDAVNTIGRSIDLPMRGGSTAAPRGTRSDTETNAAANAPAREPDKAPEGGLSVGLDARINDATVKAGMLKQEDGEIVADGNFIIRGSGTKEDPYEVSWDLLQSSSNTYVPRLSEKIIPQRIAMLHDKWVTIAGYIAFPIVSTESDELLAMLNQWDGCCIGVPPSPYDAVEVKLRAPVEVGLKHQIRFASITGIFRVQPYVMERWLVGLYLMDEATLSQDM